MRSHSAIDAGGRHREQLQRTPTLWLNAKLPPNCLASHGLRCPSDHGVFRIMPPVFLFRTKQQLAFSGAFGFVKCVRSSEEPV